MGYAQDHSSTAGSHHVLVRAQRPSGNECHILYFASGQPCSRRCPHSSAGDDEAISAVQLHEHTYRLPFARETAVDRRWTGSCMRPTFATFLRHANMLQTESPGRSCCFARPCNQVQSHDCIILDLQCIARIVLCEKLQCKSRQVQRYNVRRTS